MFYNISEQIQPGEDSSQTTRTAQDLAPLERSRIAGRLKPGTKGTKKEIKKELKKRRKEKNDCKKLKLKL